MNAADALAWATAHGVMPAIRQNAHSAPPLSSAQRRVIAAMRADRRSRD